ncbi:DUF4139 domain-containing protein [Sphingomonas oligophenolica]|uniref:DUF4139 domain-containing protein n=1 Tax=Sphingomonas oligophenolica TaxID=301154 RepID=A0ABU9Y5E8_9SPHN
MRGLIALSAIALVVAEVPVAAQEVVSSPGPDSVSVTVYRAPNRGADEEIDRNNPDGFALITETRTVRLPAGRSVIRFQGVAGNIFPETALVSGLPQDVREKNLDADLLSPRSLYDRALGRRVMIRRTNPGTGKVIEEQATIRSSADGAAVLQTGAGFEAKCSGLPETLVYDGVPDGLSAKPTLSIQTDSDATRTVKLTLSYLAGGFDWQADYVVQMRSDGRGADMIAWVTLASSDVTSFANAGTQVVAGKPNRSSDWSDFGHYGDDELELECWPVGAAVPPPPPPPPPPPMEMSAPAPIAGLAANDIVVTSARRAKQEELGDFKLYRIEDPVTVASKAQKQVAFLSKDAVQLAVVYVSDIYEDGDGDPVLTLRAKNTIASGLGVPLPAGRAAVFEQAGDRPMLVGDSSTDDKAVGEDVEFKLKDTVGVDTDIEDLEEKGRTARYRLTVTNANPWPIAYEAKLRGDRGAKISADGVKLGKRDGVTIWTATVPANGTATLDYRIRNPKDD